MTALGFHAVCVSYPQRQVVDQVTFDVPAGEITALVGPSGSGKSSLLFAVNRLHGLRGMAKVRGDITLGGASTRTLDDYALRRRVGLIFQQPTPFPLSISENIAFPLRAHGVPRAELSGRVEASLRKAALWDEVADRLNAPAQDLSGGQQQRLCLARALAMEPHVLLLDEPCASLDPLSTALVEEALSRLRDTTTTLLVTHNLAQARRLAKHVVCLWPGHRGGRVLDVGTTERVFGAPADPTLRAYFAGLTG